MSEFTLQRLVTIREVATVEAESAEAAFQMYNNDVVEGWEETDVGASECGPLELIIDEDNGDVFRLVDDNLVIDSAGCPECERSNGPNYRGFCDHRD